MSASAATPASEPATEAVREAEAMTALGAATHRLSGLLGLDVHACFRRDGKPEIAIVVLDAPVQVLETHGATRLDAIQRATAFLDRLSAGAEQMRARRAPAVLRGHDVAKELPTIVPAKPGRVVRLGGSR